VAVVAMVGLEEVLMAIRVMQVVMEQQSLILYRVGLLVEMVVVGEMGEMGVPFHCGLAE